MNKRFIYFHSDTGQSLFRAQKPRGIDLYQIETYIKTKKKWILVGNRLSLNDLIYYKLIRITKEEAFLELL